MPKFSAPGARRRTTRASAGAFGNTIHQATAPQAGKTNTVTFAFTGTEVALLAALRPIADR